MGKNLIVSDASSGRGGQGAANARSGLFLLFEAGHRPSRSSVQAALADHSRGTVTFASNPAEERDKGAWLELLLDGLAFDCLGLAPGPALGLPISAHRIGIPVCDDMHEMEAIGLFPGPHCDAAAHTLPVVRAQMVLGKALALGLTGVQRVAWSPARAFMATTFFIRAVEDWVSGGPFPALALVAYDRASDGAIGSEGLAFFTGQEVSIARQLAQDPVAATRLAARVVNELVGAAPLQVEASITGPGGEILRMLPCNGGTVVRIAPG